MPIARITAHNTPYATVVVPTSRDVFEPRLMVKCLLCLRLEYAERPIAQDQRASDFARLLEGPVDLC